MVRIAYFGTDGCPGHYAIPIRGKFTEEDIKVIESVESDVNILMVDTGQKVASNWNPTEHDIMSNDWEIAG